MSLNKLMFKVRSAGEDLGGAYDKKLFNKCMA
ncbi:MAG: hypothetical protein JWP78_2466 [Mucilaginibacter sp.]|nr:hypothetical protein [Mucilaginibacter sp.]